MSDFTISPRTRPRPFTFPNERRGLISPIWGPSSHVGLRKTWAITQHVLPRLCLARRDIDAGVRRCADPRAMRRATPSPSSSSSPLPLGGIRDQEKRQKAAWVCAGWGLSFETRQSRETTWRFPSVPPSLLCLGPGATKLSVVFSPKAVGNENKLGGFIFY
jgi:hypothetical protein